MTTGPAVRRWYQFSMRSLLIVTAMIAVLLVPVVNWVTRERQILRAREEALRAVVLAERDRAELRARQNAVPPSTAPAAGASALIERLQRENAQLKQTIEQLRRELERLETQGR